MFRIPGWVIWDFARNFSLAFLFRSKLLVVSIILLHFLVELWIKPFFSHPLTSFTAGESIDSVWICSLGPRNNLLGYYLENSIAIPVNFGICLKVEESNCSFHLRFSQLGFQIILTLLDLLLVLEKDRIYLGCIDFRVVEIDFPSNLIINSY